MIPLNVTFQTDYSYYYLYSERDESREDIRLFKAWVIENVSDDALLDA